jgi:hypothetical protein
VDARAIADATDVARLLHELHELTRDVSSDPRLRERRLAVLRRLEALTGGQRWPASA